MEHFDLKEMEVVPHQPQILHSKRGEARSILIELPAGELLEEHQVHESAYLFVVGGEIEITQPGQEAFVAKGGFMSIFDPAERHEIRANVDSRLLLLLAPWPGNGHPGTRD